MERRQGQAGQVGFAHPSSSREPDMRSPTQRAIGRLLVVAAVVFCGYASLVAQEPVACSRVWVGHEAEFERALVGGRVTGLEDLPIGVTNPRRGSLDPPTPVARFTWKPLSPGYRRGYKESYKAEIAAYKLDRLLELGMVPPVVEREIDGVAGAAVYWIENMKPWETVTAPRGPE